MARTGRVCDAWLWRGVSLAGALFAASPTFADDASAPPGQTVYAQYCAGCHDQADHGAARMPPRSALQQMSAARILRALDTGLMMSIAYPLRRDQREAVARYLGGETADVAMPATAFCGSRIPNLGPGTQPAWNGWSPGSTNARFQSGREAGLSATTVGRLELKWAFGFADDVTAFAAPTVFRGLLFVGSARGTIHALDARSGCVYWTFEAGGGVRAAPLIWRDGKRTLLLVGDLSGMFYALDAANGQLAWKRRIDEHEAARLTGSPTALGDLVFVPAASWEESRALSGAYPCCTFRGSVTALHLSDGSVAWKTWLVGTPRRTNPEAEPTARYGPSGAAVWSAPTIDVARNRLYVATGDNYSDPSSSMSDAVVAIDLRSGRILWSKQTTPDDVWNAGCASHGGNCPGAAGPDLDFGSSPVLVTAGGRDLLLAGQKSAIVYALDPSARGRILWQRRVGKGGGAGGIQWGMAVDGRRAYVAVADAVRVQGSSLGAAPLGNGGFDPAMGGGLSALEVSDGARAWYVAGHPCTPPRPGCSPAQPGAVTAIPGVVFSGSMDGHVRAFSAATGLTLWDVDTVRTYETVNGIAAKGGSLDGAGPVIAGGMLYVNSGYPRFGGAPGNVLLAFSIDGR